MTRVPFRADQVGSLLRPASLIVARKQAYKGLMPKDELTMLEDAAIRDVIAKQEEIGLKSITDGEFRRQNYILDFFQKTFANQLTVAPSAFFHRNEQGDRIPINRLMVKGHAKWTSSIFVEHFAFLKATTKQTPKLTLPSPIVLHFFGGDEAVLGAAYKDRAAFWADLVEVYRAEFAALAAAGCTYVQVDETSLVKFGDPDIRSVLEARGDDWKSLIAEYVEVLNAVIASAPSSITVGVHVCRGNRKGFWQAETGYEYMAEQLFRRLRAKFYFLEFDSPRAGSFEPLALVPDDRLIVLGLITTKAPDLEDPADLQRRIHDAMRFISKDQLGLSTQCGFSGNVGNTVMSAEQQFHKLRLVVETARSVWDDA